MNDISPAAAAEREAARHQDGTFGAHTHTDPGILLHVEPPVTESIAKYLDEYASAEESYSSAGDDDDRAYECWEDFQTDNSGRAVAMLEAAKAEIERLQAQLAARTISADLRDAIDQDFENDDEPLLYIPEDGFQDGWEDVIASVDGNRARKYTRSPEGELDWHAV